MKLSRGARAALQAADENGLIHPPLPHFATKYDPVPPEPAFRSAHLMELHRNRLADAFIKRPDSLWIWKLRPEGWKARK